MKQFGQQQQESVPEISIQVGLVFGNESVATGRFSSSKKLRDLFELVFPRWGSSSLSTFLPSGASKNFVVLHHAGVEVDMSKTLESLPLDKPGSTFGGRKVVYDLGQGMGAPHGSLELHLAHLPVRRIVFVVEEKSSDSDDDDKIDKTVVCEGEARPSDTLWSVFSQAYFERTTCCPSKLDFEPSSGRYDFTWDQTFDHEHLEVKNGRMLIYRKSPLVAVEEVVERVPDKFLVVGKVQAPKVSPETVDALEKICSKSLVGKGRKTVHDEVVRRSLEIVPGDDCLVEWTGLEQALDIASKTLMQGRKLRAEIYKVLVYREGDFFDWHRDSKKDEGHLLTMCVDAGMDTEYKGGDLVFKSDRTSENDEEDEDRDSDDDDESKAGKSVCERWSSSGGGSFACFFATQPHAVRPVTEGRRVIITYNIFADDEGPFEIVRPERSALMTAIPSFALVGPDISWRILKFLDLQSMSRLMQTSKSLALTGTRPDFLLGYFFRNRRTELMHALQKKNHFQMGMVLAHQYSFDGKQSIPWNQIRGRDAICVSAMRFAFGDESLETTSCLVCHEKPEERGGYSHFSICKAVSKNFPHPFDEEENPELTYEEQPVKVPEKLHHLLPPGCTKISRGFLEMMQSTETDRDNREDGLLSWPFFFTSCITSSSLLAQVSHGQITDSEHDLWGNEAQFSLYWYADAIMLIKLLPPPLSPDIL